jgi:hypothetical protein
MKTLLRTLLYLALMVWLGAIVFFSITAAVTFQTLQGQSQVAGSIIRQLLHILHNMGMVSGIVALALLILAPAWNIYKSRAVLAPMILLLLMLTGTAYSQFGIIPAMERDRISAGGAIDTSDRSNPLTVDFDRLHHRSTNVEGAVLIIGLLTVIFIARAESTRA